MNQSIYMRLSNGIDRSIDFTANNEASFTTECRSAWRRYRAEFATPEYFAAQQQLNELRHLLEPDLNGSNKAIKISEWIGRGHSPEKAESLWSGLLDNRRIQLANAKLRLKAHMMPDYLEIHVSSISSPGKHWFNPAMGVCGVRIYADMRIEARTHAGLKKWSWGELWCAVRNINDYERQLLGMGDWIREQVAEHAKQKKACLTLVKEN